MFYLERLGTKFFEKKSHWVSFAAFRHLLYIYCNLYIQISLAEKIIVYAKRYIRGVDLVVLQLGKDSSFFVYIWCARKRSGHNGTGFLHKLKLLGDNLSRRTGPKDAIAMSLC